MTYSIPVSSQKRLKVMPKISDVATVELQGPRPNVGFSPLSFWHYFRFPEIISKSYLNFQKVLLIYEKGTHEMAAFQRM